MSIEYDEVLESFVIEATEAVADLENDFLTIEENGENIDVDLVNKVFRNIHSIKGTAGFCGLQRIGGLAHEMENVLNLIRNQELNPTPGCMEILLRGADQLTAMVTDVVNSNEVDTSQLEEELKAVETLGPPEHRDANATAATAASSGAGSDEAPAPEGDGSPSSDSADDNGPFSLNDDDDVYDVMLPDGSVAFLMIPTGSMNEHRRDGRHIHLLTLDLIAEQRGDERHPAMLLQELEENGSILQAYVSTGAVPPIETSIAEQLEFIVLYASATSSSELADLFDVNPASVTPIAEAAGSGDPIAAGGIGLGLSLGVPIAATDDSDDIAAIAAELDAAPPAASPAPEAATAADGPASTAPSGSGSTSAAKPDTPRAETPQAQQFLRVSVQNLDTLMNLAGELVLSRNQLNQGVSNEDGEESLESIAARIDRITSELQEAIMQTRMQPVGAVFNKFPRIVRDLSKQLDKQIELDIHGKEVELDKSIIEAIGDPLTHLIRNACDHGVEVPDARISKGKEGEGRVVMRAFHQAGKVFITIEDDGAGIDPDKMRANATKKGLMNEDEAQALSDSDAQMLIFHPGFSTAAAITDVSGRGVGMDVVRTNIEMLGGSIEIQSEVNVGTTFRIQLPLTLAIIPSLVVVNGDNRYAIPQTNISELMRVKPEDISERIGRIDDAEVLRLRGDLLPLISLRQVMKDPRIVDPGRKPKTKDTDAASSPSAPAPAPVAATATAEVDGDERPKCPPGMEPSSMIGEPEAINIIVIEAGTLRYGLVVDDVADSQEIVVKPLGRHMKNCQTLAGATILGDGDIALILDLTGVANHGRLSKRADRANAQREALDSDGISVEMQSSLIFSNHSTELFAVPTALISRIERVAAADLGKLGGKDILQYSGHSLPLISLEHHVNVLPREEHDHYHVVVFTFAGSDIGLIAPQLVDIHGISTQIDQVTFSEPGIIGSVIENERPVRIVDVVTLGRTAYPDRFVDESPKAVSRGPVSILLAEDSNFFRRQVISFLESDGYEVVGCEDGQIAWDVLQDPDRTFDLILTDIEMPNMNGVELTATIRADPMTAHLPIIALSSLSSDEDIKKARNAGVNDYQIKMDRDELLKAISTQLDAYRERAGLGVNAAAATGVPA
ncbi:MAG: chemotaxis protein CheW [Phycisphaerales bacterium]